MATGDAPAEGKLVEAQKILDYAFFVLCFAQFERESAQESFEVARDRRRRIQIDQARGWDVDGLSSGRRVRFEDRVALVLDRTGSDYGKVIADYQKRNHIAHGGLSEPVAPLDQFVQELFDVSSRFQT